MASHIVGYPRMGPKRELKFALESFWDGKSSAEDLEKVATDLRANIWKQMAGAGIKYIPSNTFAYYDQVLDTTAMLGAVPDRYSWTGGEINLSTYFSMARGNATVPAMEMTKWFDTNYHFIVPELGPNTKFSYSSHKAINEYKEAKALGVDTVPVLVGPVSYLLLSKAAKGVEKSFSPLSLLDSILPVYKEVIAELKAAGASWIQFDEPTLVKYLKSHQLAAFSQAYTELESALSGLNVLVETYFADVPAESYKTLTSLSSVTAYGFDLERGTKTLELVKSGFPAGKYLFAGVVDGRNIWADDLAASLTTLQSLEAIVGKDKLVVSTSCSLMHTAVDLVNETKLDDEIKSWLAFAAQKVVEVNALAKALAGQKDEAYFAANAAALASRRSSPRVTNEEVQKAASALKGSDHCCATTVSARLDAQQKKLNLPVLPTTTIGSFPQTVELRRIRREYKAKKISEEEYTNAIKEEISKVFKIQEELDIDVLVHGEPERNDMVEYFGEQLPGFTFTANGWVQSYGSTCVKPPIIYGDVSRPNPMTVFWSKMAQSMTARPMKGMLTGPLTILNWSFVRNDQPRFETCNQIALAIKKEVEDLEAGGIQVIQIDEAALREGFSCDVLSRVKKVKKIRSFPFHQLATATNNFSNSNKLGQGGFGTVFKGHLEGSHTYVAIKRISKESNQGKKEFDSEVSVLSDLSHDNLVQLIGWCEEDDQLLLVYEFMPNGSLDAHLKRTNPTLAWETRYKIIDDVGSALRYLHVGWTKCVLHRDIKPANIMLDSSFNAKLGDFGLARIVKHGHLSNTTRVKGSFGYMDYHFFTTGEASIKSDMYSFGVVLLEVACGRSAVVATAEESTGGWEHISDYVRDMYNRGKVIEAADARLLGGFRQREMEAVLVVGLWCTHPDPKTRPSIEQAVDALRLKAPLPGRDSVMLAKPTSTRYDCPAKGSMYSLYF